MNNNIYIEKESDIAININIGVVAFLKMFLRGITNFSFMKELYGKLAQAKIGEKVGVHMINGDIIIAVRRSSSYAEIVSAYNLYHGNEEISGKLKVLANTLEYIANGMFKIHLLDSNKSITARAISTMKKRRSA